MRWIYYKLRQVLQSAMIITNCDSTDGAFGLAKCTVRVSTSGLYDFPPKPYKLDLIFFAISVVFLKMGKHSDYCKIRHASTTWKELLVADE